VKHVAAAGGVYFLLSLAVGCQPVSSSDSKPPPPAGSGAESTAPTPDAVPLGRFISPAEAFGWFFEQAPSVDWNGWWLFGDDLVEIRDGRYAETDPEGVRHEYLFAVTSPCSLAWRVSVESPDGTLESGSGLYFAADEGRVWRADPAGFVTEGPQGEPAAILCAHFGAVFTLFGERCVRWERHVSMRDGFRVIWSGRESDCRIERRVDSEGREAARFVYPGFVRGTTDHFALEGELLVDRFKSGVRELPRFSNPADARAAQEARVAPDDRTREALLAAIVELLSDPDRAGAVRDPWFSYDVGGSIAEVAAEDCRVSFEMRFNAKSEGELKRNIRRFQVDLTQVDPGDFRLASADIRDGEKEGVVGVALSLGPVGPGAQVETCAEEEDGASRCQPAERGLAALIMKTREAAWDLYQLVTRAAERCQE